MAELSSKITAATPASTLSGMKLLGIDGTGYKQFPDSLFQPYHADLASIAALTTTTFGRSLLTVADASAARTALELVTTTGGNGEADSGKVPLLNAEGGFNIGSYSNVNGNTMAYVRNGMGTALAVGIDLFGYALYGEINGTGSAAFHAHVTASATGDNIGFQGDVTGGTGVNYLLQGVARSTGYFVHGYEYTGGLQYDRFTINAQGGLTWYANGTTLTSGTDKTTLTPATPSGTHTVTIPAVTGTLVTTGDTGSVTNAMLAGSIALSKLSITGTPDGTKFLRDDGSWQAAGGGGGGIGGSTGATDNRVLRADGTGGSTLQSSSVTIDDSGNLSTSGTVTGATVYSNGSFVSLSDSSVYGASLIRLNTDTYVYRDAASIWNHRNGTTAQAWRLTNTYTGATNYEWLTVDWKTTANVCRLMTEKGSGGGTARELHLGTDALASIKLDTSGGIDLARLSTTTETITPDKTFTLKIGGTSVKVPCL